jgi:L-arabinose isomerase
LKIGNTNSRLRFSRPPAKFMEVWCANSPTHHDVLEACHQRSWVKKLSRLLGIEHTVV